MASDPVAVILAAGRGTRMRGAVPKVLAPVAGEPMIVHVLRAAAGAGLGPACVVVGHGADRVEAAVGPAAVFARQPDPAAGTGDAAEWGERAAPPSRDMVLLYGDMPLVRPETLRALVARHREGGHAATLVTAVLEEPAGFGRILRDGTGALAAVREERDASLEEREIREVNTGIYAFRRDALRQALGAVGTDNAQGQRYLGDVVPVLIARGERVGTLPLADPEEATGVNDRAQLARAESALLERRRSELRERGVTVHPSAWPAFDLRAEPDAVLGPLAGTGPGVSLGAGARVGAAWLERATLAPGARIGMGTVIRPVPRQEGMP